MLQKLLFSAGLMLIIFPSWGQEKENLDGVELKVFGIVSPEKVDRMPIVKPSPGFSSNMVVTALSPDFKSDMPIYNDLPAGEVRSSNYQFKDPALRYGESRFGPLPEVGKGSQVPKLKGYSNYPAIK